METTENPVGLYPKLLTIQQKIMGLGKDKSALSYKYVTGDKVLGEIKPLMNSLGLLLKQEVLSIENVRQDYKVGKGNDIRDKSEINSKVMMRFTWVDCASGEKDETLFGANGQNDWDKGVGSALTYAERYFLLKFFHIATDEDDIDNPDKTERQTTADSTPAKPLLNDKLIAQLTERYHKGETDVIDKAKERFTIPAATETLIKTKPNATPEVKPPAEENGSKLSPTAAQFATILKELEGGSQQDFDAAMDKWTLSADQQVELKAVLLPF